MKQSLVRYLPLLLLAIAWEVVARLELVSTTALPPLSDVISAGIAMVKDGELISNGASSLYRAGAGLALAILIGGTVGIAMAWWKPVNVLVAPHRRNLLPAPEIRADSRHCHLARFRRWLENPADISGLHAACDDRRIQRRAFERAGAGLVGAQHGRQPAAHVVGRRDAKCDAGIA